MAECHPVGFQWVMEAKQRGATVIHVDPRYTRTSAVADLHVPLRAGSDIVFLGAIVNHILSTGAWFEEYVKAYTNAAVILREDFQDVDDLDGVFSGYDPETGTYDTSSWNYDGVGAQSSAGAGEEETLENSDRGAGGDSGESEQSEKQRGAGHELGGHGADMGLSGMHRDETLQHPRCVFQVLKRHYARYTPELVEQVCGVPPEQFAKVCEAVTANSGRERTTAWVYSVGWTHHTVGIQYIRGAAIIQLLLGNMGRPGGGIMALRGHASIQGSTDIPTLFNLLPGYLPMPTVDAHGTLPDYLATISSPDQKGFWTAADAYTVSLLKAWWGDAATAENDFCFDHLPRLTGDHGTYRTVMDMLEDTIEGYFVLGQNPAVGSAHGKMQRLALAHLDWLVVRDLNLIETATFWKDSPEIETGELRTEDIGTEVFFLPAATHVEKEGTFTQTHRMLQWRHKAVEPPGDCRSELQFFFELGRKIRERLAGSTLPRDRPVLDLTWDYPLDEHGEVSADAVLREINGYHLTGERAGRPLSSYTEMTADGATSGGCWIYTGVYADGVNQADRRKPGRDQHWVAPEWGWAWPANRRTLYNRASADPQGRPWSERKAYVWWDEEAGRWTGHDVPDFVADKAPSYRPEPGVGGPDGLAGDDPFVMQADGKGWLFAPTGLLDGPMPAHYEPQESPVSNPLYRQQANPTRQVFRREDNLQNPSGDEAGSEVYPYVFTTYRLTEHHTAGGMSRWLPYLAELQPEFFCEVSPELAAERGLEHLGWATITSARTAIEARVLVTDRVVPLRVGGRVIHQVGLPYHWGVGGDALVSGDAANDLFGVTLDANVHIQESKVASCDIRPGRRPTGPALLEHVDAHRRRAGVTILTGNEVRSGDPTSGGGAAAVAEVRAKEHTSDE
ncbi:molybdopterin-dependent oxidoreductase [Nakamurella sp. YIM 132084]|uniref:Molybdopterin-dependent oxidoreductase n=3 Tax=Nakamurella leprariae TaxID=2803911 RepID=A0A939BWG3_9ACTN|nr:molybdopterin-dependent oxidoreductase [Nakamurella leprariae]